MAINYIRMRATAKRLLTDNGMQYAVTRKGTIKMVAGKEVREPDLKNVECWDGSDHVTRPETYSESASKALKN